MNAAPTEVLSYAYNSFPVIDVYRASTGDDICDSARQGTDYHSGEYPAEQEVYDLRKVVDDG